MNQLAVVAMTAVVLLLSIWFVVRRIVRKSLNERNTSRVALLESELKLHAVVDLSTDPIFIKDVSGKYIFANPALANLFGYSSAQDVIGKTDADLYDNPEQVRDILAGDRYVLDSRRPYAIERTRLIHGREQTFITTKVPYLAGDGTLLGVTGIAHDISDRKAYEQQIQDSLVAQSMLVRQLLHAQEAERRRLSMDIHDGPLQSMGVALMALDRSNRRRTRGEHDMADSEISSLRESLAETVSEVRAILADLSLEVLTTYGLAPALTGHAKRLAAVTDLNVNVSASMSGRLPADLELLLYRLVQEALANVRKHAGACDVAISIEVDCDDIVHLSISDDGKGFDVLEVMRRHDEGRGMGLGSMRERVKGFGGDIAITSLPGKGTSIDISCPLSATGTGMAAVALLQHDAQEAPSAIAPR